jgi:hypothetical protein
VHSELGTAKTFCSSRIFIAKRDKMILVTEDQSLSKIARKHVQAVSVQELLADLRK